MSQNEIGPSLKVFSQQEKVAIALWQLEDRCHQTHEVHLLGYLFGTPAFQEGLLLPVDYHKSMFFLLDK